MVVFFLSLEEQALHCFEVETLQTLFNDLADSRRAIESFWLIRETVMAVCRIQASYSRLLSDIPLKRPEIRVITERLEGQSAIGEVETWISQREFEIKELRKLLRIGRDPESRFRVEKLERFFKVNSTNAGAVVHFIFMSKLNRERKVTSSE